MRTAGRAIRGAASWLGLAAFLVWALAGFLAS
jgi:hypothetical protein